jgi:pimeloyl-ACP methyl ester carboxylesterase
VADVLTMVGRVSDPIVAPGDGERYAEVLRADWRDTLGRFPHPRDGSPVFTAPTPQRLGADPLILLHGVGNDGRTFAPILPTLASRRPVLAPVLDPSLLTDAERTVEAVDRLVAFLAELAPPPWRLVGHSMGGVIGGLLMRARPELVAGAVLVNSPLPGVTRRIREGVTFDRTGRALLAMQALAQVTALGRPRLPRRLHGVEVAVVRNALRGFVVDPASFGDDVIASAIIAARTRDADRFLRLARRLPDWELAPFAAVPVQIVLGADDPLISADDLDGIRLAYPRARIDVVAPSGHLSHLEQPRLVVELIERTFTPI